MLQGPPTPKQISRMYYELSQAGAACSGGKYPWPYRPKSVEEKIILAAEMTRYDPRLLGILVEFFLKHWKALSPQGLRQFYSGMTTSQTLAVVAEFTKSASDEREIIYLMEYLQRGLKAVPTQFYFINLYAPGSKLSQRAAENPIAQFKKWGFLARETPTVNAYQKKTVGHLDRSSRFNVLQGIFKKKKEISLNEYRTATGHSISRQQALQDLKTLAKLKRGTKGRGARWVLK